MTLGITLLFLGYHAGGVGADWSLGVAMYDRAQPIRYSDYDA